MEATYSESITDFHLAIEGRRSCPHEGSDRCPFVERSFRPAVIPPPDKVSGIIVSRDPPISWLCFYNYAKEKSDSNIRRRILYSHGIPESLCLRILRTMKMDCLGEEWRRLYDLIYKRTYWTHLHKCFTGEKGYRFKWSNARRCGNTWLSDEIRQVKTKDTKFLVVLGRHVEAWFKGRSFDGIEIINLFHPSSKNNHLWSQKDTDDGILSEKRDKTKRGVNRIIHHMKAGF